MDKITRRYRYTTADVFTDRLFQGNPVAVVLDAEGLSTAEMQAIAREFNYVESTFVLAPSDPDHTARVRIFTPDREIPFAGHPNIGTAFVLAREASARGEAPTRMVFEEIAGLVPIDLHREGENCVGAELTCPEPFSRRGEATVEEAASCLSLAPADIRVTNHLPQIVSVGLPFLAVELASRDALRRARPDKAAYTRVLPRDGAHSVYAYTQSAPGETGCDIEARMFTARMVEDPATGSATAAVSGLVAQIRGSADLSLRIQQGADMGRPSALRTHVRRDASGSLIVTLAGRCVAVMEGALQLPWAL
jgi:trans-2,3-dihydro-3-hydroxyanthranilate isomerase